MEKRLKAVIRRFFQGESSAHDYFHLERVAGFARRLWEHEGGRLDVILAASYLHDIHRHLERLRGEYVPSSECEETTLGLIDEMGLPREIHRHVLEAIAYTDRHSFGRGGRGEGSLEARIVRDADNLDAMGAIGIARAFAYGGKIGEPLWVPGAAQASQPYTPGAPASSVVHHFHEKLLRLKDDFDTPLGRKLAMERHHFMVTFLERFHEEWDHAVGGDEAMSTEEVEGVV